MNPDIKFPLFINDKVYYNLEELPEEYKKLVNLAQFPNIENTISTKKEWNINGVTYSSLEDIPEEFKKYVEDKDNNGIPDFIEANQNTSIPASKPVKLKETPLEEFYGESQDSLHKNKYIKINGQGINSVYIFVALLILIIVALVGYILMSAKV
jgi:hypothetical protein